VLKTPLIWWGFCHSYLRVGAFQAWGESSVMLLYDEWSRQCKCGVVGSDAVSPQWLIKRINTALVPFSANTACETTGWCVWYSIVWYMSSTRYRAVTNSLHPVQIRLQVQHRGLPSAGVLRWHSNSRMHQARGWDTGEFWLDLWTGASWINCSSTLVKLKNWLWTWGEHHLHH